MLPDVTMPKEAENHISSSPSPWPSPWSAVQSRSRPRRAHRLRLRHRQPELLTAPERVRLARSMARPHIGNWAG